MQLSGYLINMQAISPDLQKNGISDCMRLACGIASMYVCFINFIIIFSFSQKNKKSNIVVVWKKKT